VSARDFQRLVEELWGHFDRFDFAAVGPLLHHDFVCEWPQMRERIRGRDNYIAINEHYPGRWRIAIQRIVAADDGVATQIRVTTRSRSLSSGTGRSSNKSIGGRNPRPPRSGGRNGSRR
jgi:hypothetical protein